MENVDVLIIYELKSRELENSALIAAELERRGYTTKILYNYSTSKRFNLHPSVIIVPHAYNEEHMAFYLNNKWHNNRNVISMQYEQILSKASEDGVHNPSGQARMAQHTAWGQAQVERYLKNGIERSHIHDTGSVSMDLYRPEFRSYFKTRKEIGDEFGLDVNKEWVLFISSFSYAKRSESSIQELSKLNPNAHLFAKFSDDSYSAILLWIQEACRVFPEKTFIYRRHPAELDGPTLSAMEKEFPNFRCIDAYSMRQWSIVADKLYNWYSTSLADVYYAHKPCYILRPRPIPSNLEVTIMENADFITTSAQFLESLVLTDYYFPVSSESIQFYYSNSLNGKMAYQKIADLCEQMIANPEMGYDYKLAYPQGLLFYLKYLYDFILYEYCKRFRVSESFIHLLGKIPCMKGIVSKLTLYSKDLYHYEEIVEKYKDAFARIISDKSF